MTSRILSDASTEMVARENLRGIMVGQVSLTLKVLLRVLWQNILSSPSTRQWGTLFWTFSRFCCCCRLLFGSFSSLLAMKVFCSSCHCSGNSINNSFRPFPFLECVKMIKDVLDWYIFECTNMYIVNWKLCAFKQQVQGHLLLCRMSRLKTFYCPLSW